MKMSHKPFSKNATRMRRLLDFNRSRWEWLQHVNALCDLSSAAKVVVSTLVTRFADKNTGKCVVNDRSLAEATGLEPDTVYRLLKLMRERGLIEFQERGRGRGVYYVTWPEADRNAGQDPVAAPGKTDKPPAKGSENSVERPFSLPSNLDRHTGKADVHPVPPTPPYKDIQTLSPNGAFKGDVELLPSPFSVCLKDAEAIREWNEDWLRPRGHPDLETIAAPTSDSIGRGYLWPSRPPNPSDELAVRSIEKHIAWSKRQSVTRQARNCHE